MEDTTSYLLSFSKPQNYRSIWCQRQIWAHCGICVNWHSLCWSKAARLYTTVSLQALHEEEPGTESRWGKFLIAGCWKEGGQSLSQVIFVNRWNVPFPAVTNWLFMSWIYRYVLFDFQMFKSECFLKGHFSEPSPVLAFWQMTLLIYLSSLPLVGIWVGSLLLITVSLLLFYLGPSGKCFMVSGFLD
jgi:hypothetical protein